MVIYYKNKKNREKFKTKCVKSMYMYNILNVTYGQLGGLLYGKKTNTNNNRNT